MNPLNAYLNTMHVKTDVHSLGRAAESNCVVLLLIATDAAFRS